MLIVASNLLKLIIPAALSSQKAAGKAVAPAAPAAPINYDDKDDEEDSERSKDWAQKGARGDDSGDDGDDDRRGSAQAVVTFKPLPPPRIKLEPVRVEFTKLETGHLPARSGRGG